MQETNSATVSLYVVKSGNGQYFAGFDVDRCRATFVDDPRFGKKFTNKYDIKLRPDETLVELLVDLTATNVKVSEPFRPHRRTKSVANVK